MIKTLQRFIAIVLLTVFIYGSVGVSFHVHECNGSGTRHVSVYPELFGGTAICGCEEEPSPLIPDGNSCFSQEACCINSYLYLKADFKGFTITYQQPADISKDLVTGELTGMEIPEITTCSEFAEKSIDHPPPLLSGRTLVTFLHQIKIPTPIS
jgi:hypothetical protein